MKLSSKTHYGLKACYIMAKLYPEGSISASALEKEIAVSGKYLEKVMRILSGRDIISAKKGAAGGYYLKRPPSEITVGEVVRALEDDMEIAECVAKPCKASCPSGAVWKKLYDSINSVLDGITIEQMLEDNERRQKDDG